MSPDRHRRRTPDFDSMKEPGLPPGLPIQTRERLDLSCFCPSELSVDLPAHAGGMIELRSDTETRPRIPDERSAWRGVVPAHCATGDTGVHLSTYISAVSVWPIRTTPALVAHSDYCDYPGFFPSTPVIFPLFSSDFTDLARPVNTLTLHVASVI